MHESKNESDMKLSVSEAKSATAAVTVHPNKMSYVLALPSNRDLQSKQFI